MRAGWQTLRFCDLGRVFNGNSISESDKEKYFVGQVEGLPYIATKDVGFDHSINYESGVRIPAGKQSDFKLAPANTVLVCAEGGSAGRKIAHLDAPVFFGNKLFAISPDHSQSSRFVFYYCLSNAFSKQFRAAIAGLIGGVSINKFKELSIQLPAAAEQYRIVGVLDEDFDGIATAKANAEKNLQNARELFASHLHAVFTLDAEGRYVKPIGDVCSLLSGFAFKSGDVVTESQTQLIRMGNLYGNALNLDRSPIFYPNSFAVEYERYLLKEGDLIMSLTGTTGKEDYGYAVRISDPGHQLLMNQRIAKFHLINMDVVTADYLFYYLRSRVFLDILYPTANGTRQANLSSVTIKTLPIPLYPIPEQKRKVRALEEMANESQRLEGIYQQKLTALDDLKKSLLYRAFNGDL